MGIAQDLFADFITRAIAPRLKADGFRKQGPTFRLPQGDNWGVVNFQKSDASTAAEVAFTANIGIASARLGVGAALPSASDCQLSFRLGELLPDRPPADYWWIVDADTDMARLASDFASYLDAVVPLLRSLLSDDALAEHWLAQVEAGRLAGAELRLLGDLLERTGDDSRRARLGLALAHQNTPEGKAEARRRAEEALAVARAAADTYPDRYIRTPLAGLG